MSVKKITSNKKQVTNPSLRASAKQSRSVKNPRKIASSPVTPDPRNDKLSVPVYSLAGRAAGTMSLPKEIFGQKINKKLLAQAMRVYMTNQKNFTASTKTRGEVQGSTAKIYRQKGTGRARHGAIRAPIFVGGGITFGPKPRHVRLELPQKMKKTALLSALSSKMADKEIFGISGLEKASGKTKEMYKLCKNLKIKAALIVTGEKMDNVVRAVRNIPGINVLPANLINAYEIIRHKFLLLTKETLNVILGMNEVKTPESESKDSGQARMTKGKTKR